MSFSVRSENFILRSAINLSFERRSQTSRTVGPQNRHPSNRVCGSSILDSRSKVFRPSRRRRDETHIFAHAPRLAHYLFVPTITIRKHRGVVIKSINVNQCSKKFVAGFVNIDRAQHLRRQISRGQCSGDLDAASSFSAEMPVNTSFSWRRYWTMVLVDTLCSLIGSVRDSKIADTAQV